MDVEVYDRLVEAAKAGETVTYGELGEMLHLDFANPLARKKIGEVLGEISRFDVAAGRPMLSSLVTHKDDFRPGTGFFKLGLELGLVRPDEDEMAFEIRQIKETWAAWEGAASA